LEYWNIGMMERWNNGFKSIEHGAKSLEKKITPCSLLLAHNIPCVRQKEHASINHSNFPALAG